MSDEPDRHDTPNEMTVEERADTIIYGEGYVDQEDGRAEQCASAVREIRAAVKAETERCAGLRPDEQYVGLPAIYWDEAVEAYAAKIREGEKDG